jgi:hypothetical protein
VSKSLELFLESLKTKKSFNDTDYALALRSFDISVCEAMAVGQAVGMRYEKPYIGYSTHVFARLCSHARALIEAAPRNRWVKKDSHSWDLSFTAGHTRAIMEGYLLFSYIAEEPSSNDEWLTKINIMNMNDCVRRKRLFKNYKSVEEETNFLEEESKLKDKLLNNQYFIKLDEKLKNQCLKGKVLMIPTRDQILEKVDFDVGDFNALFDTLSNFTHILPMSYYRMSPNGRGSGLINEADFTYTTLSLLIASGIISSATDRIVEIFPDTEIARKGLKSKFTPGPKENRPKHAKFKAYE